MVEVTGSNPVGSIQDGMAERQGTRLQPCIPRFDSVFRLLTERKTMGYMTEMGFLNDDWHRIKENIIKNPKDFTDFVDEAMSGTPLYHWHADEKKHKYVGRILASEDLGRVGWLVVHASHHADDEHVYSARGNTFRRIDCAAVWTLCRAVEEGAHNPFNSYGHEATERDLKFLEAEIDHSLRNLKMAKKALKEYHAKKAASND